MPAKKDPFAALRRAADRQARGQCPTCGLPLCHCFQCNNHLCPTCDDWTWLDGRLRCRKCKPPLLPDLDPTS